MDEERRDCMRIRLAAHAVVVALLMIGCAEQPATSTVSSAPPPTAPDKMDSPGGDRGSSSQPVTAANAGRSTGSMGSTGSGARVDTSTYVAVAELTDIHFDFDKYEIRATDAAVLDRHAAWLKQNADRLILIEGHTDERGTSEYNVALGERRARAVMLYLLDRGISTSRVTVTSYGVENPECREQTETCWARNRRVITLVRSR